MRKTLLIIALLLQYISSYSQTSHLFTSDRELSSSMINKIYQDQNNMIWIATEDGLNRYDGSKFTIYKNNPDDPYSICSNYVRTIFEDSKGRLFIGTYNGVQMYNPATDKFSKKAFRNDSIPFDSNVIDFAERSNGEIWITGNIFSTLTVKGDELHVKRVDLNVPPFFSDFIIEDTEKNLWIGNGENGIIRISHDLKVKRYLNNESNLSITDIKKDKLGNIYVGTIGKGLLKYSKSSDSFLQVANNSKDELPIKTIYIDKQNDIYIGTDGKGLKILSQDTECVENKYIHNNYFEGNKAKVHSVLIDNSGNTWLAIFQKGAMVIPAKSNKFNYIGHKSINKNFIGNNCITSFFRDKNNYLWIGTDNDGLYGITQNELFYKHFAPDKLNKSVPPSIMCIYEDSEDNLWVGSYTKGLAILDRKSGKCTNFNKLKDNNGKSVQRVYSLTEDNNKRLWIATMGSGLFYYDLKNKEVKYPQDINRDNRWNNCMIFSPKEKKLYVGNYDGINAIDISQDNKFNNEILLRKHIIYSLYLDEKSVLWAGSAEGLIKIDTKTKKITHYTTKDGLSGNTVYAIQGDNNGKIWVSTNDGISQYNPNKNHFTNYYMGDGLQGNEFYKNASMKDANGTLWFGGINGITYFNPEDISNPGSDMNIRITDFYLKDQPVRKGTLSNGKEIIDSPVFCAKDFYLGPNDNSFSIEFSCIEMTNPEAITYSYSLDGESWVKLPMGSNRASLVDLSAGTYTFLVKAINNNRESNIVKINIHIAAHWWKTDIAYFIYLIILSIIVFFLIRIRNIRHQTKQEMLKHKHSEEINEAKLQFFINIYHEIRTPISLIINPLQKLLDSDKDITRQKIYHTIYNNSQRILVLLNQLMDVRKIDKGLMVLSFKKTNIKLFIENICEIFSQESEKKNIKLSLYNFDEIDDEVWIDPSYFDKIIINILSNAMKYTPTNGNIDIFINKGVDYEAKEPLNKFIEIAIQDNGIGISKNEIEHIFERFYQIRNNINSSNIGTGIGLNLTLSLIELHHGSIKVESNTEEFNGTKFIIRIPLGKSHLKDEEIDNNVETIKEHKEKVNNNVLPITFVESDEKQKKRATTKFKILIADDDDDLRKYLSEELSQDYNIIESKDGRAALELIFKTKPDLVLSDIMMPGIDGISLCRKIKQNFTLNHIPVILLTAIIEEENNLSALENGADSYMTKPFKIDILKRTIANLIRSRESLKAQIYDQTTKEKELIKLKIDSPDDKLMQRIMKSINANIGNPNFTIEHLSKDVGISRVHLHRKLKELTNQTTRDFIRNIRLEQAALLLSQKHYTINEVSTILGFSNANNFSTSFKELYGVTPTEYMENSLAQKDKLDSTKSISEE